MEEEKKTVKMCTIYLKEDLLNDLGQYMEDGEKLSPFICRALREYITMKSYEIETGTKKEFQMLCNSVKNLVRAVKEDKIQFKD